jgi:hypothetical protein
MSLLDLNLENTPDLEGASEGEHTVTIVSMGKYEGKNSGKTSLKVTLKIADQPNTYNLDTYLGLPQEGDEKDKADAKRRGIKGFCKCFDIPIAMFEECYISGDYTPLSGLQGWVLVKNEEFEGQERPKISRFIAK